MIPVRGVAKEFDRLLVAVGRAVAFTEAVVGEAEAVERRSLTIAVVGPSLLVEGLGAAGDGLDIIACGGEQPTDRVERPGFARVIADQPVEPQRLATVCERLVEPAVQVAEFAVVVQRLGLADRVAETFVQVERTLEPVLGRGAVAQSGQRAGEQPVGDGLTGEVVDLLGGPQRDTLGCRVGPARGRAAPRRWSAPRRSARRTPRSRSRRPAGPRGAAPDAPP